MKRLVFLLSILLIGSVCFASQQHMLGVLARKNAGGALPDETIGWSAYSVHSSKAANIGIFTVFTASGTGNVRYAYLRIADGDAATVCLSLQADSDGGTVHLSGATTASDNTDEWLEIDMGSTYAIQNGVDYRLTCQSDASIDVYTGTFDAGGGNGTTQSDTGWSYSCGAAMTDDAAYSSTRPLAIVFKGAQGSP